MSTSMSEIPTLSKSLAEPGIISHTSFVLGRINKKKRKKNIYYNICKVICLCVWLCGSQFELAIHRI